MIFSFANAYLLKKLIFNKNWGGTSNLNYNPSQKN